MLGAVSRAVNNRGWQTTTNRKQQYQLWHQHVHLFRGFQNHVVVLGSGVYGLGGTSKIKAATERRTRLVLGEDPELHTIYELLEDCFVDPTWQKQPFLQKQRIVYILMCTLEKAMNRMSVASIVLISNMMNDIYQKVAQTIATRVQNGNKDSSFDDLTSVGGRVFSVGTTAKECAFFDDFRAKVVNLLKYFAAAYAENEDFKKGAAKQDIKDILGMLSVAILDKGIAEQFQALEASLVVQQPPPPRKVTVTSRNAGSFFGANDEDQRANPLDKVFDDDQKNPLDSVFGDAAAGGKTKKSILLTSLAKLLAAGGAWKDQHVHILASAMDPCFDESGEYDDMAILHAVADVMTQNRGIWQPIHVQQLKIVIKDPTLSHETLQQLNRTVNAKAKNNLDKSALSIEHKATFEYGRAHGDPMVLRFHHDDKDKAFRDTLDKLFHPKYRTRYVDKAMRCTTDTIGQVLENKQQYNAYQLLSVIATS